MIKIQKTPKPVAKFKIGDRFKIIVPSWDRKDEIFIILKIETLYGSDEEKQYHGYYSAFFNDKNIPDGFVIEKEMELVP